MIRAGLVDLASSAAAGLRGIGRYRGLLIATFVVQLLLSLIPAALVFALAARIFGRAPVLGRALDGDLAAVVEAMRTAPSAPLVVLVSIVLVASIYVGVSWFLTAGLIGVYGDRPDGAASTARCFGAHGARRVFAFARLFALSTPIYAVLAVWAIVAIGDVADRSLEILTGAEIARALIVNLAGPALLLWLWWTAVDHARVALVRDEHLAAWRAMARGALRVARRPVCAVHTAAGHLAVLALAAIYVGIAGLGLSVLGLLLFRQLVAVGRHAVHLAILGGQVELDARITRAKARRRGS